MRPDAALPVLALLLALLPASPATAAPAQLQHTSSGESANYCGPEEHGASCTAVDTYDEGTGAITTLAEVRTGPSTRDVPELPPFESYDDTYNPVNSMRRVVHAVALPGRHRAVRVTIDYEDLTVEHVRENASGGHQSFVDVVLTWRGCGERTCDRVLVALDSNYAPLPRGPRSFTADVVAAPGEIVSDLRLTTSLLTAVLEMSTCDPCRDGLLRASGRAHVSSITARPISRQADGSG